MIFDYATENVPTNHITQYLTCSIEVVCICRPRTDMLDNRIHIHYILVCEGLLLFVLKIVFSTV